jgi:hypothetical protein
LVVVVLVVGCLAWVDLAGLAEHMPVTNGSKSSKLDIFYCLF